MSILTPVVVECGVCGKPGPWMLTLCWWDESARADVPGGQVQWLEPQPRYAIACSMECGRRFAEAAGKWRLRISRPETDAARVDSLIRALNAETPARWTEAA